MENIEKELSVQKQDEQRVMLQFLMQKQGKLLQLNFLKIKLESPLQQEEFLNELEKKFLAGFLLVMLALQHLNLQEQLF
jgi:hypothetical protein